MMARIRTCGFELIEEHNTYSLISYTSEVDGWGSTPTIAAVGRVAGTYALGCIFTDRHAVFNFSSLAEFYLRVAIKAPSSVSAETTFLEWSDTTAGTLGSLRMSNVSSPGRKVRAYVGSTLVGESTTALFDTIWRLVELHVLISATVGVVELKIDGNLEVSFNGDTQAVAAAGANRIRVGGVAGTISGTLYVDDFALNDTTGTMNNTWPGDGYVRALLPNGAGTYTGTSVQGAASNYLAVDEKPIDNDTSYVYGVDAAVDTRDSFNIANLGAGGAGIPTNSLINTLKLVGVARKDMPTPGALKLSLRHGGVDYDDAAARNLTTTYAPYTTVRDTRPNDGQRWTVADIDALEIGWVIK